MQTLTTPGATAQLSSRLGQLQDEPAQWERKERPCDSSETTKQHTPIYIPPAVKAEGLSRPLNMKEIWGIRRQLKLDSSMTSRFRIEIKDERDRIDAHLSKKGVKRWPKSFRDSLATRQKWFGYSIKKRWFKQREPDCRPAWDIQSGPEQKQSWLGPPEKEQDYDRLPFHEQQTRWPPQDQETLPERALRERLKELGLWLDELDPRPSTTENGNCAYSEDKHEEFRILYATRPWFLFLVDYAVQLEKLSRFDTEEAEFHAQQDVVTRWKDDNCWNSSWFDQPGWRRENESRSPSPLDPYFPPPELAALNETAPTSPVQQELSSLLWMQTIPNPEHASDSANTAALALKEAESHVSTALDGEQRTLCSSSDGHPKATQPQKSINEPAHIPRRSSRIAAQRRIKNAEQAMSTQSNQWEGRLRPRRTQPEPALNSSKMTGTQRSGERSLGQRGRNRAGNTSQTRLVPASILPKPTGVRKRRGDARGRGGQTQGVPPRSSLWSCHPDFQAACENMRLMIRVTYGH